MTVAFVYPFWQEAACGDELRWSIRSIFQHFKGDEIRVIVVGDQPILPGAESTWFDGMVIDVPRLETGVGEASIRDAAGKFLQALKSPCTPSRVVWMMDDIFFLRDLTWDVLSVLRAGRRFTQETLSTLRGSGWWRAAKKRTAMALLSSGLPAWDFATHLPHAVDRDRAIEVFDRFQIVERALLWEMIYQNAFLNGRPVHRARPFLKLVSGVRKSVRLSTERLLATVLNVPAASWCDSARQFLSQQFPNSSPLELEHFAPPRQTVDTTTADHDPRIPALQAEESLARSPVVHRSRPSVTAVLNAYGRPSSFVDQFNSMRCQSVSNEILVWQNAHESSRDLWRQEWFDYDQIVHGKCSRNLGVWARFAFALNARTEFVCVFDDDVIPGTRWFENCIQTIHRHNGLQGGHGVIFHSRTDYRNRTAYGWMSPNRFCVKVDIVGHAWFFRREWLALYWSELPSVEQCWTAGEDFHFSYMLQKHGIGTFVPQHRRAKRFRDLWSCAYPGIGRRLGRQGPAICRNHEQASKVRDGLAQFVGKGFRLVEDDRLEAEVH